QWRVQPTPDDTLRFIPVCCSSVVHGLLGYCIQNWFGVVCKKEGGKRYMKRTRSLLPSCTALVVACLWLITLSFAQIAAPGGQSIGRISVNGDLIVMELEPGALGKANLFDLEGRTLRFLHDTSGYRAENTPLEWDSDFGPQPADPNVVLHN